MQAKKGKGATPKASLKLEDSVIQEYISSGPQKDDQDPDQQWLWGQIAATTSLIDKFLVHTEEWEALEVCSQAPKQCG